MPGFLGGVVMGKVERWVWGVLIGALVLGLLMLFASVPQSRAQGSGSQKREVDQTYRLIYYEANVGAGQATIRFPDAEHGVNAVTTGDSTRTTSQGSGNAIRWVQLVQLDGTARLQWIVYADVFPAGEDTLWTFARKRAINVGGFAMDSVRCLGNATDLPDIQVWVSD